MNTYRLDRRFALQIFGWRLIVAAVLVMLGFVVLGIDAVPDAVSIVLFVLGGVSIVWGVLALARPPRVVTLTSQGYRVGRVPDLTVRSADWTTVVKVKTQALDAGLCLVLDLADGTTTAIPLALVARRSGELQRAVHDRLNAAHGYRPLA